MTVRELIEQLHALADDQDVEVFVQMVSADGQAHKSDQSGPATRVVSGDHPDFGVSLGVYIEAIAGD